MGLLQALLDLSQGLALIVLGVTLKNCSCPLALEFMGVSHTSLSWWEVVLLTLGD